MERQNRGISLQGRIQEREVGKKRINDFTAMFEKGKCMVSVEMWSDLQVPWCFPFMCRADYQVIFSGKNELTDALR